MANCGRVRAKAGSPLSSGRGKAAFFFAATAPLLASDPGDLLRIGRGAAPAGTEGIRIPVVLSHSQPMLAVSLAVCVDAEALRLERFSLEGACLEGAEGFFASCDGICGIAGVLLDLDPPYARAPIPPQADRTIAYLVVHVRPGAPFGFAGIRLAAPEGSIGVHNVYTNELGLDVRPALRDGEILVTAPPPRIDALKPPLAIEEEVVRLIGRNFADDGTL